MTAYELGWISADAGATISDNPFHPNSYQAQEWAKGFNSFLRAFI